MSDTNQNSWTNGKSENYEDGWYQDEYGEWLNEFDWHQDENGEWYYEDSYDYEADGWKQVGRNNMISFGRYTYTGKFDITAAPWFRLSIFLLSCFRKGPGVPLSHQ